MCVCEVCVCVCVRTYLKLCLEEELLRTLGAVVDLVFLPVDSEDVLLQLIGLDEHCGGGTEERV